MFFLSSLPQSEDGIWCELAIRHEEELKGLEDICVVGRRERGGDGGCRENGVHQDGERGPVLTPWDREGVGSSHRRSAAWSQTLAGAWAVPSQTQLWGSVLHEAFSSHF